MKPFGANYFDRRLKILQLVPNESISGAGQETWAEVATVRANVEDRLPSRGEQVTAAGFDLAKRPARVRMRYREGVTSAMRFEVDGRTLVIVAGPAELGRRQYLEFMAEEYQPGAMRV